MTGSTGFVGQHVVPLLEQAFPESPVVRVTRRRDRGEGYQVADLADADHVEALVRDTRPGLVVHLAAHASVGTARSAPEVVWRNNRTASVWLARAIGRHAPDATVFLTSTAEVYGRSFMCGPADETTPLAPVGPYAHSKVAQEHAFRTLLPASARLIVARPFNHTGPGQSEAFVVPAFAAQLARIAAGLAPPRLSVGNLAAARDFLDVRDVAAAYLALIRTADDLPQRALFNAARGRATCIRDILGKLIELSGLDVEVRTDPTRLRADEIAVATGRTDRLATVLPWPPQRSLEATLGAVYDDQRTRCASAAA